MVLLIEFENLGDIYLVLIDGSTSVFLSSALLLFWAKFSLKTN